MKTYKTQKKNKVIISYLKNILDLYKFDLIENTNFVINEIIICDIFDRFDIKI